MADSTAAEVLVVSVAYESDRTLPGLIASIEHATSAVVRVVVVDNGPISTSVPLQSGGRIRVERLESSDNPGYGTAVNRGVGTRRGERWLAIVNPDVVLGEGSIDTLIAAANADSRIGMVGPKILTPSGEVYPSARSLPSLRTGIGHALFARSWRSNPWTRRYLAGREVSAIPRDAGWLSGSCMVLPMEAFLSVAGFDESYFMYFEDVDLAARIHQEGRRVVFVPDAQIVHEGGASTTVASRRMVLAHHTSAYQYLSRRYRAPWLAPLRVLLRLGLHVRARLVRG